MRRQHCRQHWPSLCLKTETQQHPPISITSSNCCKLLNPPPTNQHHNHHRSIRSIFTCSPASLCLIRQGSQTHLFQIFAVTSLTNHHQVLQLIHQSRALALQTNNFSTQPQPCISFVLFSLPFFSFPYFPASFISLHPLIPHCALVSFLLVLYLVRQSLRSCWSHDLISSLQNSAQTFSLLGTETEAGLMETGCGGSTCCSQH